MVVTTSEEFHEMVEQSGEAGHLEEDERELLEGALEFADTLIHEVMTPRADIIFIEEDATLEEIKEISLEQGFSRLLVTSHELDEVKGVLLFKDLVCFLGKEVPNFRVSDHLREAHFVSSIQPVDEVLHNFQKQAIHLAVVLDEHGGVDGIVTLEDLVEEIVGDIFDEHDSPEEEAEVRKTRAGDLIVDAGMLLSDLNEEHDFQFPKGEYSTVAGYLIHVLGRIPKKGEQLVTEQATLVVVESAQNRVTRLRICPAKNEGPKRDL